ncbi:MAG: hypothetical protein QM723_38970 [Myxococcaceae bacterium]
MRAYSFARNGLPVRIGMTVVLLAGIGFFVAMMVLVSHHEELRCEPDARCVHVEHYPFGIDLSDALPKVTQAEVMWDPGGRSMALKLVLRHDDGSKSEYQGVGKNGERAEETARAINAFLAHPAGEKAFPLRDGSIPVAIFLGVLALAGALLVPTFFTRIRLAREGNMITVVVGRWPARRRVIELPADAVRFGTRPMVINGEPFFSVCAERTDCEAVVELGVVSRFESVAMKRVEALRAWLAGVTP